MSNVLFPNPLYSVERRNKTCVTGTEDSNCFLGSTIESCEAWMKGNADFEPNRESVWWWAIVVMFVDTDMFVSTDPHFEEHGRIHSYYDWDANPLDEQPGC